MNSSRKLLVWSRQAHSCRAPGNRKGAILVLSAFLMIVVMAIVALSVDVGYIQNVQTELDRAVDASALAGAGALPQGLSQAENTAFEYMQMNPVANTPLAFNEVDIQTGHWDEDARQFIPSTDLPSALRIVAERNDQRPLFFARVFGRDSFDLRSQAVATFQPRDIMVVLDYSASMNDDSEFKTIPVLGREAVETNIQQIYQDLGSPQLGTLLVEPQYMTVIGQEPSNSDRPQLSVEYRYNHVYVTSTKPFDRVLIYRSSSSYKSYYGSGQWNADKGVYEQTLTYDGSRQVKKVRMRSGYNNSLHTDSNRYEETIEFDTSTEIRAHARTAFNLNAVPYPYPSGSWDDYIDYCRSSSNQNGDAGYFYRFGYLNLVNYWLDRRPASDQTPDLWKTSEQPITAVKNSVDVFLAFMQEMNTSDRVGLAVYNSSSGWGKLEQELTLDYGVVSDISRHRQAGHYHSMTNIAAGLDTARNELEQNAREGALKMIVLMTDGVPTYPNSSSYASQLALNAAQECASRHYPVVTISLGTGADTALMQQIAAITGGLSFNIPGGQTVAEYEQELMDTYRRIAEERPLRLVSGKYQWGNN